MNKKYLLLTGFLLMGCYKDKGQNTSSQKLLEGGSLEVVTASAHDNRGGPPLSTALVEFDEVVSPAHLRQQEFSVEIARPGVAALFGIPQTLKNLQLQATLKYPPDSVYRKVEAVITIEHPNIEQRDENNWVGPNYSGQGGKYPVQLTYFTRDGRVLKVAGATYQTPFFIKRLTKHLFHLDVRLVLYFDAAPAAMDINVTVAGRESKNKR